MLLPSECRSAARDQQTGTKAKPSLQTFILDLDTHAEHDTGVVPLDATPEKGQAEATGFGPTKLRAWAVQTSLDPSFNAIV